jgi:hypothetical protein
MKQLAYALALMGSCVLASSIATTPAFALETYEAKMEASDAASQARIDMLDAFGPKALKPGKYLWRDVPESAGPERVVISLSDQLAYLYRGDTLMAVAAVSSGKDAKPTPWPSWLGGTSVWVNMILPLSKLYSATATLPSPRSASKRCFSGLSRIA